MCTPFPGGQAGVPTGAFDPSPTIGYYFEPRAVGRDRETGSQNFGTCVRDPRVEFTTLVLSVAVGEVP